MSAGHDRAPGGGPGARRENRIGVGSGSSLPTTADSAAPVIVCRYAGVSGAVSACGAFDVQHRAEASRAGVCCVVLAFDLARGER